MSILCKKEKSLKQEKNKGFTNLQTGLRSCAGPEFEQIYVDHLRNLCGCLDNFCFTSKRDSETFKILQWITMKSQPLTEVDDRLTRDLFSLEPRSSETVCKYILSLVPIGQDNIRVELPSKFCVMLNGSSDNHIHYVELYCTYEQEGKYQEKLIACAPFLKVDELSTEQNCNFILETLSLYRRVMEIIICLVGDSYSVNRKLADLFCVLLVSCYL